MALSTFSWVGYRAGCLSALDPCLHAVNMLLSLLGAVLVSGISVPVVLPPDA